MYHFTKYLTRAFLFVTLVVFTTAMTMTAWGQTQLLDENFGYSTGQLTAVNAGANVSGGNWVNFSGTTLAIQSVSGSLSYTDYAASGLGNMVNIVNGSAEDAYRGFTAQTTGTVYASFLVRVDSVTSMLANANTAGDYFAGFLPSTSTTALVGRVSTRQGSAPGTWQIGIRATSTAPNTAAVFSSTDLSAGTTYNVVIGWVIVGGATNDTAKLWLNPTLGASEPAPTVTQVSANDNANFARFFLRQGTNTVDGSVDGIRVGTTWDDVNGIPGAPVATTDLATSITTVTATLGGTVNPNFDSTTISFDYGTTIGYGSSIAGTPGTLGSHGSATAVSAPISGLVQNQLYHFRVVGSNTIGTTNGSDATFTTVPDAPVATAATSVGATGFTANWTPGAGNAPASYTLDVSLDAGFTTLWFGYPLAGLTGTSYVVTGLSEGTPFWYRVRGVDAGGTSANSNDIAVLTIPAAPTATAPSGITASSFTANWTAPGGTVTDYRLDVSTDIGFGSFVTGYNDKTVAATSDAVTGLATSVKHYYRVRAVNASGTSANSNIDSATTVNAGPPSLSDPTATSITTTTATLGATIDSDNNDADTERGVVWSLSANPTTADNKVIEGSTGVGTFTVAVSGLPSGTLVHYRGYAINGQGTGYTLDATFYTIKAEPSSHAGSFAATTSSSATIDLSWTVATGADGYIILQRTGSDPTGTPIDATEYSDNDVLGDGTVAAVLFSGAATTTEISGLSGGTGYHFSIMPFAWDGVTWETINYKTDPTVPTTNATTFSSSSDAIATPGFFTESNVDYNLYTSVVNIDTSNSLPAFGLTVRDGGGSSDADAVPTELVALSLTSTNSSLLSRAALYDGGIELAEVAVTGPTITFSPLGLNVADNGSRDLTVYLTFSTTVTDNAQIALTVSTVTADGSGSGFASADGGGAASSTAGDDNRIEVVATALAFAPPIANANVNTNFTASAKATDANNNTDLDFVSVVNFSKDSGPGTLSGATGPSAIAGVATTTNLQFNTGGSYVLRAQSGGLTDGLSNTFVIIAPGTFYVAGPMIEPTAGGGPKTTLAVDTLLWRSPATWVMVSGGSATGYPSRLDTVILDNTYKAGSYVVKAGSVGQDTAKQITIGYPGNPNTIMLLAPVNSATTLPFSFGNNAPGNYDMIVDEGGIAQCDRPTGRINILGFSTVGDSLLIKPGGQFIHHSVGSLSGILIGHSKNIAQPGGGIIEVRLPTSPVPSGGSFHFTTSGFVGPTLKLSADSAGVFDNSTSQASAFGSAFITGDFIVGPNVTYIAGTPGSYEGDLFVRGNVINNGTMNFSSNSQNVLAMIGTSPQTISGNAPTFGKGIFVGNSAGVTLLTNINVTGGTVQTTGTLNYLQPQFSANIFPINAAGTLSTGSQTIFLNPGGAMNEGSNPVQGNVSATRTATQNVNQTFGTIGVEINALGDTPGVTTIDRKTGVASTGNSNNSILRYYDISAATNSALNAVMKFSYADAELNGNTEADLLLHKSTDSGTTWTGKTGAVNTGLNQITATGVQSFSRWTAAASTAPLFITHTITVRKVQDTDGDIFTTGDQSLKKWRLSLYRDSVTAGTLVNTQNLNSGIMATLNLEAGTYIATEEDSAGWLHLGTVHNGSTIAGSSSFDTVTVSGGTPATIDFINQQVSALVVRKFVDTDGDASTIESPKTWHLAIYKTSVSGGNLITEGETSELVASDIQAGTYIVVEADSGSSWVRLNGNQTRYDTIDVSANTTVYDTLINFQPNTIVVNKYQDNDGQFGTDNDRTLLPWYLEVRQGSSGGTIVASGSTGTITLSNVGDGTYYIAEADSAGWIHLGKVVDGTPISGTSNNHLVSVSGGQTATVDFVNAPPIYSQSFRSFNPDSIALDKDNFGKVGKYVKRKADKVFFKFIVSSPQPSQSLALTLKFGILTSGAITKGITKLETLYTWTNLKDVTTPPLDSGLTFQVEGVGYKGKAVKVSFSWATLPKVTKGTVVTYIRNQPKLPMPNRVNALLETFEQSGFASTSGLPVGIVRSDSSKFYGWVRAPKYSDVLKTLSDKNGRHNLSNPRFLAYYDNSSLMKGLIKSLPPSKHNNGLVANLMALRLNIVASQLGKTPPGFGELMYDGAPTAAESLAQFTPQGMKISEIADFADTVITGFYWNATHIGNIAALAPLNDVVRKLNDAFEGAMDTIDFATKLHLKGTKSLLDVPYLKAIPGLEPTILAPAANPIAQVPDAYTLHQNYPNPFNPTTTIAFDLAEQAFVTLKVYNVLGQEVATLFDRQQMDDGAQEVQFNASKLSSGVYFYRIIAEGMDDDGLMTTSFVTSKKMLLVK